MQILRFILPFLFVRNWQNGSFELSRARCVLFGSVALIVLIGVGIAFLLQAPFMYTAS